MLFGAATTHFTHSQCSHLRLSAAPGAGPGAEQNLTPAGENNPQHLYAVRGQTFCNKVNVAWQLTDTGPSDGGFVRQPSRHMACVLK